MIEERMEAIGKVHTQFRRDGIQFDLIEGDIFSISEGRPWQSAYRGAACRVGDVIHLTTFGFNVTVCGDDIVVAI